MTKKTILPFVLGALLMVGAGCAKAPGTADDGSGAAVGAGQTGPGAGGGPRTVTITLPAVAGSGEYGRATLTAIASNQVRVVITLTGSSQNEAQTAAIHSGPCSAPGAEVQYPLAPVVKGRSETLLNVSMKALVDDTVQSIRVKRDSVDALQPLASCGNLR